MNPLIYYSQVGEELALWRNCKNKLKLHQVSSFFSNKFAHCNSVGSAESVLLERSVYKPNNQSPLPRAGECEFLPKTMKTAIGWDILSHFLTHNSSMCALAVHLTSAHRITEQPGLEGTSGGHPIQNPKAGLLDQVFQGNFLSILCFFPFSPLIQPHPPSSCL